MSSQINKFARSLLETRRWSLLPTSILSFKCGTACCEGVKEINHAGYWAKSNNLQLNLIQLVLGRDCFGTTRCPRVVEVLESAIPDILRASHIKVLHVGVTSKVFSVPRRVNQLLAICGGTPVLWCPVLYYPDTTRYHMTGQVIIGYHKTSQNWTGHHRMTQNITGLDMTSPDRTVQLSPWCSRSINCLCSVRSHCLHHGLCKIFLFRWLEKR